MTLLFDLFASPSLFCLSLLLSLVQAQVSVVNGASVYQGTTVSQNIHGIPTLIYNCAKVPALCENVHQQYPLNDYIHTFAGVPPLKSQVMVPCRAGRISCCIMTGTVRGLINEGVYLAQMDGKKVMDVQNPTSPRKFKHAPDRA